MHGWNEYRNISVITTDGVKEIRHLRPGDSLYQYKSRETFRVMDIIIPDPVPMFTAEYTDGRKEIYGIDDPIYLGIGMVQTPNQLMKIPDHQMKGDNITFPRGVGDIHLEAFQYTESMIHHPYPDPYLAGALITYGDYDDEYINLPAWTDRVNNLFAHKYDVEYAEQLGENDKRYFVFNETPSEKITWKEMFPYHDFFALNHDMNSPVIPKEYVEAPTKDRWNYIRGAFDAGYDRKIFPDTIGCASHNGFRMIELQKMLWSMGIMSELTYLPMERNGRIYHLEIIGKYARYPGFFYDPDNIGKILHLQNHTIDQLPMKKMQLKSLTYEGNGMIPNIIAEGWPKVYFSENFIPRISK